MTRFRVSFMFENFSQRLVPAPVLEKLPTRRAAVRGICVPRRHGSALKPLRHDSTVMSRGLRGPLIGPLLCREALVDLTDGRSIFFPAGIFLPSAVREAHASRHREGTSKGSSLSPSVLY